MMKTGESRGSTRTDFPQMREMWASQQVSYHKTKLPKGALLASLCFHLVHLN